MQDEVKPSDILIKAQELLGDRGQRWIKGNFVRRRSKRVLGIPIPLLGEEYAYCSLGAVLQAATELGGRDYRARVEAEYILSRRMDDSIMHYNDKITRRFDSIKKAFCAATKDALELEEKRNA